MQYKNQEDVSSFSLYRELNILNVHCKGFTDNLRMIGICRTKWTMFEGELKILAKSYET